MPLPFETGLAAPPGLALALGVSQPLRHPAFAADTAYVNGFRPDHDRLAAAGLTVAPTLDRQDAALALVAVPRHRALAMGRIAAALKALRPGGVLIVDGQKTDGVEPVLKALNAALPLDGVLSKAHGKIAWAARPDPLPAAIDAWVAGAAPRPVGGGAMTAPGVFSADGLDPATALLIDHLPGDATGDAADLGAGWGALAAGLLARAPSLDRCDLIEADHMAAALARQNVTDPRARVHWADATEWPGGPYRLIAMNPPFHTGRAADPALGQAFIRAAAGMLHPKGRLYLVANRQLPYEGVLDAAFRRHETLAADARYKILTAAQPRRNRAAA